MLITQKTSDALLTLPAKELTTRNFRSASSPLAEKILKLLSEKPMYPKELARELNLNEQKIYYHIRHLQKNGFIEQVKHEAVQGAIANYYSLTSSGFFVKFKKLEKTSKISTLNTDQESFFTPFILNNTLNATIIVGSPDPHGAERARSRDSFYAIELALLLGSYLNNSPLNAVKLDTETHQHDLKNNLIIIGGPVVNKVTEEVNDKLPIRFNKTQSWNIESTLTNEIYTSDEIGIIVKSQNPFANDKFILLIAGKRHAGTKAAIVALSKHLDKIVEGNIRDNKIIAKVFEGIDKDSDGIIDDIEIRE
jgi:DNA-binding transcriptional ArsR family regulator